MGNVAAFIMDLDKMPLNPTLSSLRYSIFTVLSGQQALAFIPAIVLAAFWLGGELVLLVTALVLPLLFAWGRKGVAPSPAESNGEMLETLLDETLTTARQCLRKTGCIILEVDDFDTLLDRYGQSASERVMSCLSTRIQSVLRDHDTVTVLAPGQFAIVLGPVRQLSSEIGLQLATRMQLMVEEPISVDATTIYVTASIGFCLDSFVPHGRGTDLAQAAGTALIEARRHAPSAIRAYSADLNRVRAIPKQNSTEVVDALDNGQIVAWFQPQISTETGEVSGFEALARWQHPTRGLIPPDEFLPTLRALGKCDMLGSKILHDSLTALNEWKASGLDIGHIGVNFSPDELRDPKLVDRLEWELDRFDLSPDRLTIEILENVVAYSPDDTITRNIRRMSEMGCRIDLDDFGTGHASISSIRRFAVHRLKIDRSFITKLDCDVDQQRMVNAIQLMADELKLETIAEGVETAGEHTMLAQLGCQHVQGFGIARPMPFEKTKDWIRNHQARIQTPPKIGRTAR